MGAPRHSRTIWLEIVMRTQRRLGHKGDGLLRAVIERILPTTGIFCPRNARRAQTVTDGRKFGRRQTMGVVLTAVRGIKGIYARVDGKAIGRDQTIFAAVNSN